MNEIYRSMTCTIAVFYLMIGSAALSCTALYIYLNNQKEVLKKKITSLNNALTCLQSERSTLMSKADNLYSENMTQLKEMDNLQTVINEHQETIELLEKDNQLLTKEYMLLENHIQNA